MTKADLQRMNRKADRQRRIYIDELNHRIRNILALIRSLARSTKESSTSLETYARALEQRITALSAAHDLAANRLAQGVEINEIFRTELQAFAGDKGQRLTLHGENYQIRADYAPIFALIAHELMTNSVKHGALSLPQGHIDIVLAQENQGINICWTESGGPPVTEPATKGFGFNLITNAIPYEMDGTCSVEFAPAGLIVRLWIPLNLVEPIVATARVTHSTEHSAHLDSDEFPQRDAFRIFSTLRPTLLLISTLLPTLLLQRVTTLHPHDSMCNEFIGLEQ